MMDFSRVILTLATPLLLAGCSYDQDGEEVASASAAPAEAAETGPAPVNPLSGPPQPESNVPAPVKINHQQTFEKIVGNSGISLQWISFYGAERGVLTARMKDGVLHLSGRQKKEGQSGLLEINGSVQEVNKDSFVFSGTVAITGTPDVARSCYKTGKSQFAITQGRKYFRLREFEWCDGLTDYVDVYF